MQGLRRPACMPTHILCIIRLQVLQQERRKKYQQQSSGEMSRQAHF